MKEEYWQELLTIFLENGLMEKHENLYKVIKLIVDVQTNRKELEELNKELTELNK